MLTISFVRHGESVDNLKGIWAGWKDAPLSNHGMNQAKACGQAFANTQLAAIYASPLQRARSTAEAIFDAQHEPKPPFTFSPDLREQHFGVAEGEPWLLGDKSQMVDAQAKIFPVLYDPDESFPEGESLNDLKRRAARALDELIVPWLRDPSKAWGKSEGEVHIAVVSHGLCISQLIAVLLERDVNSDGREKDYRGLMNTAWSRVNIRVKSENLPDATPPTGDLQLEVNVTQVNNHDHLEGIRQKGGIGSAAFDPNQKSIKEFFGGGATTTA